MTVTIRTGDCRQLLREMPDRSVRCCVTSPPYWGLRDYGVAGQIGLEATVDAWCAELVAVFREVRRVLTDDGTLWLNIGDAYAASGGNGDQGQTGQRATRTFTADGSLKRPSPGIKPKDLIGLPWMLAFALRADGWYLRSDIIWAKKNPMPESVRDRPTKSHEYVFLLSKSRTYYYDAEAVRTPAVSADRVITRPAGPASGPGDHDTVSWSTDQRQGRRSSDKQRGHSRRHAGFNDRWDAMPRTEQQAHGANLRTVWHLATQGFPEAHFATFPEALVEPCIKAGTSEKGRCPVCSAPWVRQFDQTLVPGPRASKTFVVDERDDAGAAAMDQGARRQRDGHKSGHRYHITTTGWISICDHDHDPVPDVVLDPFGGSGTTGVVADRLGRDAELLELNPAYAEIARRRLVNDAPLLVRVCER